MDESIPSGEPTPQAPGASMASAAMPTTPTRTRRGRGDLYGTLLLVAAVGAIALALRMNWLSPETLRMPLAWQALVPEIVILMFAVLSPLVGLGNSTGRDMRLFTLVATGGALLLTILSLVKADIFGVPFDYIGSSHQAALAGDPVARVLEVTYASQLFKVLFLGVAFLAVLGVGRPLRGKVEEDWGEFCSLILFATLGMMIVASSRDLIVLILGIEMTSMASYVLAGFRRDAPGAEASLKYFTIGAISSGLALFGVSLLYGMTGTTNIAELGNPETVLLSHGAFDTAVLVPIVMILAGLGFKISAVPFHAWAPDVYSGAPVPIAGMLAAGSKAMGFVALFNVFLIGLPLVKTNWELVVAIVAVASMFFGNLVALQQTNIRRMLAYSSIAQAGYVLIALVAAGAVGGSSVDATSLEAKTATLALGGGIFHLIVNAAMKLGAFLIVGALLFSGLPDQLKDWRGLGKRAPFMAFTMTLFLLSMAGLPPLAGFASKFVLFSGAVDAGTTQQLGWLTWLAVIAVINSAISLYVYLRVIRVIYVEEGESGRLDAPTGTIAAVAICALLVLVMGMWPQPFMDASFQAAQSFLGFGPQ